MRLGRDLLLVGFGFLTGVLIVASHAQLRLEAGIGVSGAAKPPEGTWMQDHLEHHLQLQSRTYSLGLSGDTPLNGLRWAARGVSLGQFSIRARANADDQDNAALRGATNAPESDDCKLRFSKDCHYNWHGEGTMRGALFTLGAEPFTIGPVKLGLEAGAFIYKATWRERIRPIDCPGNQCWEMQVDQRTGWQIGPEFGLTARWNYIYAAVRRFGGPEKITAGFQGPIRQFELGVSIPL